MLSGIFIAANIFEAGVVGEINLERFHNYDLFVNSNKLVSSHGTCLDKVFAIITTDDPLLKSFEY
jgi:hypothetical protein